MWLRRVRSFFALDPAERALALRAVAALAWWRVALRVLPFTSVRRRIERIRQRVAYADPLAVRRAIQRAARTLPGSTCLAQSVAAEALLRRGGTPARLTIGVAAPDARRALDAHAWVESGDILVAGDGELGTYRELLTYGSRA